MHEFSLSQLLNEIERLIFPENVFDNAHVKEKRRKIIKFKLLQCVKMSQAQTLFWNGNHLKCLEKYQPKQIR